MQGSATHRGELHPELLNRISANSRAGARAAPDRRLSSWFSANDSLVPGGVALIGFPCDIGVARNSGRPGAAGAPGVIRKALYRYTPDARNAAAFGSLMDRSLDLGDIRIPVQWPVDQAGSDYSGSVDAGHEGPPADLLLELQRRLGRVVESVLRAGGVPVILGGGHETAFGHYLGSRKAFDRLTILNWDAHADVRPLIHGLGHSGSPFRQALDLDSSERLTYVVAGLQSRSVASDHLRFVSSRGKAIFAEDLDASVIQSIFHGISGPTQVSFDLDAVDCAQAPGVSAPTVNGLDVGTWLHLAENAGRHDGIRSMDVVELNPIFDLDNRTARLAAATVWSFMRGVAQRPTINPTNADDRSQ